MASTGSKARLLVFTPGAELRVALEAETTSVGSDPRCTLSLPSFSLAAHHCVFQREGDAFEVFDLSGQGLKVNGRTVEASGLRSGDQIQAADLRMVFLRDTALPTAGAPSPRAPESEKPAAPARPEPEPEKTPDVIPFAAEQPVPTPKPVPEAPRSAPAQEQADTATPPESRTGIGALAGRIALGPLWKVFDAVRRARRAHSDSDPAPSYAVASAEAAPFDLQAHHHPAGHRHAQTWGEATLEALRRTPYVALSLMVHALLLFILSILQEPLRVDRTIPPHDTSIEVGSPRDWEVAEMDEETQEVEVDEVEVEDMQIVEPELDPVIADSFEADDPTKNDAPLRPFDAIGQGDGPKGLGAATAGSGITLGEGSFGKKVRRLRASGLDIVFVIDSTGSMSGLITEARSQVETMVAHMSALVPGYRLGLVTYRDEDDEYLTRKRNLTPSTYGVVDFLDSIEAAGGGDHPEAVFAGLREAIDGMQWSRQAKKVVILVGDAPPHLRDKGGILKLLRRFIQRGGVVHTIFTNGGVRGAGEDERSFRQISEIANGVHVPLGRNREVVAAISRVAIGADHGSDMSRTLDQSEKGWKSRVHRNLVERAELPQILAELKRRPARDSFLRELVRSNKEAFLPAYLTALEDRDLPQQARWACCVLIRRLVESAGAPRAVVDAARELQGDLKHTAMKRRVDVFRREAGRAGFPVDFR